MAGTIKGIIVEIGGDTSGLQKALKNVNSATSSLTKELRGVNSLLKLDPTNTVLVSQKQEILTKNIQETSEKLKILKQTQEKADEAIANGTEVSDTNYRNLQREIINTENKLKDLQAQASKWTTAGKTIEEYGNKIQKLGSKIDNVGNKITTRLTVPLVTAGVLGINSAAKQEAAIQQVEKIYGDASNTIKNFAENTALSFNMSTSDAYKYAQVYGNLIQSIIVDESDTALYSQQLVQASSIIASATGRTMEDVMDRIRSGLLGNTEAIEDLGVNVNVAMLESTDAFKKFSGDKSWEQLDFQTQQQIRLFGILEQTTKKYGDEVNKNTSSDIQRLTAKFKNLTSSLSKKLLPIAEKLIDKAEDFLDKLGDLTDEEMNNIIQIGLMVAAAGPLVKILGTVTKTVGTVTKGVGIFSQAIAVATNKTTSNITSVNNLAKAFSTLSSPMGIALTIMTGAIGVALVLADEQYAYVDAIAKSTKQMEETIKSQEEFRKSQDDVLNSTMTEMDNISKLSDELETLVDKNGKVKKGYEGRVSYILNELNGALGTEYKLNGNIVESYDEIVDSIDELIQKQRISAILENEKAKHDKAREEQTDAYNDMIAKEQELADAKQKVVEAQENLKNADDRYFATSTLNYQNQLKYAQDVQKQAEQNLQNSKNVYKTYLDDIATYENDYEIALSGNTEKINELINSRTYTYQAASGDLGETINHNIQQVQYEVEQYKLAREEDLKNQDEVNAEKNQKQIEAGEKQLANLAQQLISMTSTTEELTPQQIEAWKNLATNSYDIYKKTLENMDSTVAKEIEDITGVIVNDKTVKDATTELAKDAEEGFNDNVDGAEWGSDLTREMSSSMTSSQSKSWITGAASTVAGWISDFLHHTTPDKGPMKNDDEWMSDFIKNLAQGIYKNKYKLISATEQLSQDLKDKLNLNSNVNIGNLERMQSGVISKTIDSTKTIYTTPQIVFNVQELDEAKLQQCFNYINRKFGSQY